jgi:hypothetical protein
MKTRIIKLSTFEEEVEISEGFALAHAQEFDWDWGARHLLSPSSQKKYHEGEAPLLKEYQEGEAPLWEKHREDYTPLTPLPKEYKEGSALLWKKYTEGVALLFCRLYIEDEE